MRSLRLGDQMDNLWQDVKYGMRLLVKNPGFTAVVIMTLALGIGINTAIFSVVNAVLLKPLGYKEPDRVVALWETRIDRGGDRSRVTPANYLDWQRQGTLFENIATFGASGMNLTGSGEPEMLLGARVSTNYFATLGLSPILGRAFSAEEGQPGRNSVIILGHGLWVRRFGADPDIIGKAITLDGTSYTVVGVMPAGIYPTWPMTSTQIIFQPSHQDYLIPFTLNEQRAANRNSHVLGVIGRLKQGVTIKDAQSEMDVIAARLEQQYPEDRNEGILVSPLVDEVVGSVRPALLILLGTVGLVLLIACANIASLLLARMTGRQKEVAIRAALGASRLRLVRQFFVEGLLLALVGGAAGIWLALFGIDLLLKIIPQEIPRLDQVRVDSNVLGFTLLISLLSSLVFGLMPALQTSRPDLVETLKEGGRSLQPGTSRQMFRRLLVVAQVSLAVILVTAAGLLIRSFWQLNRVNPGFNAQGVLLFDLTLPQSKYADWYQIRDFYAEFLERVNRIPGVESTAVAYDHPLKSTWIDSFSIEGRPEPEPGEHPSGRFRPVSAGYFRTVGMELERGRLFTEQDDTDRPGVIIINDALARRYFSDEDPLGKRVQITTPSNLWGKAVPTSFEIVGIVRDSKFMGLDAEIEPAYYLPARQVPLADMTALIRTTGDPSSLIPAIRDEISAIDATQPISEITTLEQVLAGAIAQPRFNMILMGTFGAVALILAIVGIYGLVSFTVAQRTHEIGIRMALGAKTGDILRLVVGQGMALILTGILSGLAASYALTRVMSSLLFGVSATDPMTFVMVPMILAGVALAACFVPARRATRVDPMEALRYE